MRLPGNRNIVQAGPLGHPLLPLLFDISLSWLYFILYDAMYTIWVFRQRWADYVLRWVMRKGEFGSSVTMAVKREQNSKLIAIIICSIQFISVVLSLWFAFLNLTNQCLNGLLPHITFTGSRALWSGPIICNIPRPAGMHLCVFQLLQCV